MALLLVDGFDHYTDTTYAGMSVLSAGKSTFSPGRFGDGRYLSAVGGCNYAIPTTASNTLIMGIALKSHSGSGGWVLSIGSNVITSSSMASAMRLTVDGTNYDSSTGLIYDDIWNFVEVKTTFGSSGNIAVRLNGVPVPGISDLTGANTGTKPSYTRTDPGSWVSGIYTDDYYVCDGTGSVNNDFLGDVRVETLKPNGSGSYTQWSRGGTDSGTNWGQVDEDLADDADYVTTSGAGNKDLYSMSDLSTSIGGTVLGVQVNFRAKKSDSGTRGVCPVFMSGASEADGTTFGTIATDWMWFHDIREDKPGGTGWTIGEVNSMEAGVKVAT